MSRKPARRRVELVRSVGADTPEGMPGIELRDIVPMLVADFTGEYQVYIAAASEYVTMLRFALSLLAAPFAVAAALIGARVLEPAVISSWSRIPAYVFALLLAFGVLAFLPYLRMIEAGIARVRTARALNNFRLLYARVLREHVPPSGWTPNLPVDPHYPRAYAPLSWSGINSIVLAVLVAAEVCVGVLGLARVQPAPALIVFGMITVALILFGVYFIRTAMPPRHGPVNPLGFPDVETLCGGTRPAAKRGWAC
ncbi:MAG TPA: hypothetical protein VGG16_09150 [Streptosporangiaceae bacterium]